MKSNKNANQQLVGKRVILLDGRSGKVTHAGYDLISIDLNCGWWWCGPLRDLK